MSTAIATFGDWDFLFANALLEPNGERLPERISAAEAAINERLKAIANRDNPEKVALVDALRALQTLRSRRGRTQLPKESPEHYKPFHCLYTDAKHDPLLGENPVRERVEEIKLG